MNKEKPKENKQLNHYLRQRMLLQNKKKDDKQHSVETNATENIESFSKGTVSELGYQSRLIAERRKQYYNSPQYLQGKNNAIRNYQSNTVKVDTFTNTIQKAENTIVSAFDFVKGNISTESKILLIGVLSLCIIVVLSFTSFFGTSGQVTDEPNFYNLQAYVTENPYAQIGLYGQCTWFAWGRFYELYGYSPGFYGNGWNCAEQLVAAHPDTWQLSETPTDKCVFSGVGRNHVGIVLKVEGNTLTIQHANFDGETNTPDQATLDWATQTFTLEKLNERYGGVIFAVPIE